MYSAEVVKKAVMVIRFLVKRSRPAGVSEISGNLDLNKSTTFGILKALTEEGLVQQDKLTKRYSAGEGLIQLSKETLLATDFAALVRPLMETLSELVSETVCLGIVEGERVKVVEVVQARKELRVSTPVGTLFSIKTPALLKVYLSTMTDQDIAAYMKDRPLHHYTEKSITDVEELLREVKNTKESGYALNLEEFREGIRAVTSPVFERDRLKALLWVVGFSSSLDDEALQSVTANLVDTARRMTDMLSGIA
jgi:IclR family transcriptional regulator, KDG regulon repressor